MTYYNDNDAFAVDRLHELMTGGLIPLGEIDNRDIREVQPGDLRGFTRVHLFAGIAGWEVARQLAGWRDDRPLWTASCPCPPFSVAGKPIACPLCESTNLVWCPRRTGFCICAECDHAWLADARHLWPEVWRLVAECRPTAIYGEQVASPVGWDWLAGVRASLEIAGYAVTAEGIPASAVGAPHARSRIWWNGRVLVHPARGCARPCTEAGSDPPSVGRRGREPGGSGRAGRELGDAAVNGSGSLFGQPGEGPRPQEPARGPSAGGPGAPGRAAPEPERPSEARRVADADRRGREPREQAGSAARHGEAALAGSGDRGELGDADRARLQGPLERRERPDEQPARPAGPLGGLDDADDTLRLPERVLPSGAIPATPAGGPWSDSVWIPCDDETEDGYTVWRRTQSEIWPLAAGVPGRVGLLRTIGNSIVPQVAAAFIQATMEEDDACG